MWHSKNEKTKEKKTDSSLNGLMQDVDSYISESSQENNTPTRAQSLQQPQRPSPHATQRSNTTHKHYVSYIITRIVFFNLNVFYF